jgi:hypothetical protein
VTYRRTDPDPDPETVDRPTFVLLAEDGTAYGYAGGRPELPCGEHREGPTVWIDRS